MQALGLGVWQYSSVKGRLVLELSMGNDMHLINCKSRVLFLVYLAQNASISLAVEV